MIKLKPKKYYIKANLLDEDLIALENIKKSDEDIKIENTEKTLKILIK